MDDNKLSSKPFLKPTSFFNIKPSNFEEEKTVAKINNPFLKCESNEVPQSTVSSAKNDESSELAKPEQSGSTTRLNLFSNASNVKALLTENVGFVFGQNLHERVVSTPNSEDTQKITSPDLLFSSRAITPDKEDKTVETHPNTTKEDTACGKTTENEGEGNSSSVDKLVEAARKYEELRGAQKRKYEEVETVTGEEEENNILEINCKLFTFLTGNWEERGRGQMRLNDTKICHNKHQATTSSRLVFRASGSLRVFINTNVWDGMVCEQSSPKSLRITALDAEGQIKIYLVMGRIEDVNLLSKALSRRIDQERTRKEKEDKNKENEDKRKSDSGSLDDEPATKRASIVENPL